MTGALSHRGPDESGVYIDDRVGLGHTRLSIIDLSSGSQPIHNEDKSLWIVYNGEIYNYPELREFLEKRGHQFYTTSDTEVLLHLYEEKGADCLHEINGQFAFAIWNTAKKELFLARDHVGIRPLYYSVQGKTFLFASEIKSIFENEDVPREIDPIAMDQIFTFWTTLNGQSVFKNINELPPGHFLTVKQDSMTLKQYWDIPFYPQDEQVEMSSAELTETIQSLLLDAVRIRLRADVPVGAYLSGGLDSSIISTLVAKHFNADVHTFGIRFQTDDFDEGTYQNQMVSVLNTHHHEELATYEKIGAAFSDVVYHTEKPLLRTAPTPLFLLSNRVRNQGLKVVLTGEGADEVFGGYNIFREAKVRRFWARQPHSKYRPLLIKKLYPYLFHDSRQYKLLSSFFGRNMLCLDDPFYSHRIRWENTGKIKTLFSDELRAAVGDYNGFEALQNQLPIDYHQWDSLSKAQYLESRLFLSNYLLSSQGDRMAMAHSLEIRLPFLDKRLMEFMGRVPEMWKIRGLDEKYILKKSFEKTLPQSIVARSKYPYRAPVKQSLMNEKTIAFTRQMLSEQSIEASGLFDKNKIARLLTKLETAKTPNEVENMALVGVLSSQILHKKFIEKGCHGNHDNHRIDLIVDRREEGTRSESSFSHSEGQKMPVSIEG